MSYLDQARSILRDDALTPLQCYEKLRALPPPHAAAKENEAYRLIRRPDSLASRQIPQRYWEDLAPLYLSAINSYLDSSIIEWDVKGYSVGITRAFEAIQARRLKLVEDGIYSQDDYLSWQENGW